jgi:hypothetical protein
MECSQSCYVPHLVSNCSWCHDNSARHPARVAYGQSGAVTQLRCADRADDGPAGAEEVWRQEALRCVLELPGRGARTVARAAACEQPTTNAGDSGSSKYCVHSGCSAADQLVEHAMSVPMLL